MAWYTRKLHRKEPFSSLLYGDGEFLIATRQRTGQRMAFGEVVTPQLEQELHESLLIDSPDVLHATDLHLIEHWTYHGGDRANIVAIGEQINSYLATLPVQHDWVDGTVWEESVRYGNWAPFLRELVKHPHVLVGNKALAGLHFLNPEVFLPVPDKNAYSEIDSLEARLVEHGKPGIYLVCMGLGSIPLIMRMRKHIPDGIFLDLGSNFDVFVNLPTRGWRTDIYRRPTDHKALIAKNLEGVGQ